MTNNRKNAAFVSSVVFVAIIVGASIFNGLTDEEFSRAVFYAMGLYVGARLFA